MPRNDKGSLDETGNRWIMVVKALIEHNCEAPKFGKGILTDCFLSCMVLLHLMSRKAPSSEKMKSPLANCLLGSKDLML